MNTKLFISLASLSISILTSIPTQALASDILRIRVVSDISVAKPEPILNPEPQTYPQPKTKNLSQNSDKTRRISVPGVPHQAWPTVKTNPITETKTLPTPSPSPLTTKQPTGENILRIYRDGAEKCGSKRILVCRYGQCAWEPSARCR
jgi:hypothetical protein